MKIFLEITVNGVDGNGAAAIRRKVEHDLAGEYYGHKLSVEECEDPGEAYNRGYDRGYDSGRNAEIDTQAFADYRNF